jgi:hypothetical protein
MAVRILVDPNSEDDIEHVHALQDALGFEQPGGPGLWDVPAWDTTSQKKVRDALLSLAETIPDTRRMFGTREQVDPIRHLIGTAMGWGGNPETEALYLNRTPAQNDGGTIHRLTVPAEIPVDGFWSITVYDADGHLIPNDREMYALNEYTAAKNADGSVTVQFGGCGDATTNCLPITKGWNYLVRLYRPRPEVLDDTWTFPEARPA